GGGWIHWRSPSGEWNGQKLMDLGCEQMVETVPGRAIVTNERGFFEVNLNGAGKDKIRLHRVSGQRPLGPVFASSNGFAWAGADRALMLISGEFDRRTVSFLGPRQGLPQMELRAIAEYPAGTMWLGYTRGGL